MPAATPVTGATASGVKALGRRSTSSRPATYSCRRAAEVDEPLGEQRLHHRQRGRRVGARADGHVLVGLLGGAAAARVDDDQPRRRARRSASMRPGQSGAVARLPFDAYGLAPSMSRKSVRSMSGTGIVSSRRTSAPDDLLRPLVDRAGREEVVGAEGLAATKRPIEQGAEVVGVRVAEVDRGASRPWRSMTRQEAAARPPANASSQVASTNPPSRLTSGVRSRSGSSCSCLSVEPFGQMKPWLNTSSRSPRMRATSSPSAA